MPEEEKEIRPVERLNFKYCILEQIRRINKLQSSVQTDRDINELAFAVDSLESILVPYLDSKYKKQFKKLVKKKKKNKISDYRFHSRRYRELMRLMARLGLLFEKKTRGEI